MSEPPAKRQRTNDFWAGGMDQFAANEADEGADDDEEGWDDNDEEVDEATLEAHRKQVEAMYSRRGPATLNQDILNGRDPSHRGMNLLDRLAQKYATNSYGHDDMASEVGSYVAGTSKHATHADSSAAYSTAPTSNYQQPKATAFHQGESIAVDATLPSVQDPNLWLVPCLPGKERYAVEEILKKYFKYYNHQTKKLFIKTAFTTDMNTGYIYVEAFKEIHVRRACEDISGLNTWKLRLVPRSEMVDALTIKAAGPQIKRGQWCRLTQGLYKGDLAQVYAIMDQGSKVVLRVVPRIDYGRLSIMNSQSNEERQRNSGWGKGSFVRGKGKPPQKLFNKSEIEMYDDGSRAPEMIMKDPILQTRIIRWRGKKYKNGCHLITMPVGRVEFDVTASPEEVQLLRSKTADDEYDDEADDDMEEIPPPIFQKSCIFVRGDTVKAIRGAMTNLIGEVLTTQPDPVSGKITVTVLPEHKELNEAIQFRADDLQKHFKAGCHVKVKRGKFKDETGLIIKVEDEGTSNAKEGEVIIFSDLTSRTIRVHINDITETSEVSTGRDVLGNYALYELVHLSRDVVGVIVSIQNGTFKILDNKDVIQQCRLPDIARHSRDEHAVALDIDNNQIRIGDVILPQVGDFKSQRATVKHVYRSVLFCHTKSCTVNSGIFVCRSRLCRLAGGRMRNNMSMTQQGRSDTKNDRRLRILHRNRASRDPWMHKTVKVKRGSYKGMIGIVCAATDQKLNIELHARCKKIQIKREDVKVINQDGSEIDDNPFGNLQRGNNRRNGGGGGNRGGQPWRNGGGGGGSNGYGGGGGSRGYGDSQPMRRNNNSYNDRSRYRSADTPLIGVSTPAHSGYGDEPNLGAATPAIGAQTPAMGSQTPGYGGMTPAYPSGGGGSGSGSGAWNVGGMTPAHNPVTSPMYGDSRGPPTSTYSSNTTPASGSYQTTPHRNNNGSFTPGGHSPISSSAASDSGTTSGDDVEREIQRDPYYFVIDNALARHNGQDVVLKSVDRQRGVCSLASPQDRQRVFANGVPFHQIEHYVPECASEETTVKVVAGKSKWEKLNGELGTLIGIDNDEAVVQLTATTEVNIIPKRFIVIYFES